MESFKDLLQKLREVHEREVEGWQVKVKELSTKKGCDSKRMEELFTRNQQMKEQQRLLTENIKTLENRLRAGLCDRCTVTQEVAKRKQQEFEASQIQSLQHISLLAGEMTNLKKENLKLKDENRTLRAALGKGLSDNSSSNTLDVKQNPDLSPSSGVVALISSAACQTSNRPVDGDVGVKTEGDHKDETELRSFRGSNKSRFEVYKPQPAAAMPSWKMDHGVRHAGERSLEGFDQHSSIPIQAPMKNPSSSPEVKPSRTVVHAPIPRHPKPIPSSPLSLPWPLSESSDWVSVAAAGSNPAFQTSRLHLPRFPNLIPPISPASIRKHSFGSAWQKPTPHHPPAKEPTVVFKLRRVPENPESDNKPPEKKEIPLPKPDRVSREGSKDSCDGPLDLSDRGKSKSNQSLNDDAPVAMHSEVGTQRSPMNTPVSSPSVVILPLTSCATSAKNPELEAAGDQNKEVKDQEQKGEEAAKTDQSNGKKIPVLTLSLRPAVVRLETLNSALQKQESKPSNGKQTCGNPRASSASPQSSSTTNEAESSLDEHEDESGSGQEGNQGSKRKRASVETETDRDSDTNNAHQERRIKITPRNEEKSPN
nr:RBBP8 N-terminal-like protein [Nothobranchius furzeri]